MGCPLFLKPLDMDAIAAWVEAAELHGPVRIRCLEDR